MMTRVPFVVLAAVFAARSSPAPNSGWYAGASAGTAVLELERGGGGGTAFAFDQEDTASKVRGGYLWDLPLAHVGVELGYVDLGDPPAAFDDLRIVIDASGLTLWGVAGVDAGPVRLFGKLGGILWAIDGQASGSAEESFDESGFDLATGLGASLRVRSLELRAEVESFDIEDTRNVDLLSVGLTWRF